MEKWHMANSFAVSNGTNDNQLELIECLRIAFERQ
jgi:hypothetical protein